MNIESILSSDAHWNVNKTLARKIGILPTVVLMELVFARKKYGQAEFYESVEKIENCLGITRDTRRSAYKQLESLGMINYRKKGNPAKYYYTINDQIIIKCLSSEEEIHPTSQEEIHPTITKNIIKNKNNIEPKEIKNLELSVSDVLGEENSEFLTNGTEWEKLLWSSYPTTEWDYPRERKAVKNLLKKYGERLGDIIWGYRYLRDTDPWFERIPPKFSSWSYRICDLILERI